MTAGIVVAGTHYPFLSVWVVPVVEVEVLEVLASVVVALLDFLLLP